MCVCDVLGWHHGLTELLPNKALSLLFPEPVCVRWNQRGQGKGAVQAGTSALQGATARSHSPFIQEQKEAFPKPSLNVTNV